MRLRQRRSPRHERKPWSLFQLAFIVIMARGTWSTFRAMNMVELQKLMPLELDYTGDDRNTLLTAVYPTTLLETVENASQTLYSGGAEMSRQLSEASNLNASHLSLNVDWIKDYFESGSPTVKTVAPVVETKERISGNSIQLSNYTRKSIRMATTQEPREPISETKKLQLTNSTRKTIRMAAAKTMRKDPTADSTESTEGEVPEETANSNGNTTILAYYSPLMTSTNLWNSSEVLPVWLKEYFEWHQQQRTLLNETNWQQFRFLIPSALRGRKSGGMTDRIRPIPAMLRLAAQTKRILLVYWERPFPLEDFLLPPQGGMDWRVPEYMRSSVQSSPIFGSSLDPIQKAAQNPTAPLVVAHYQSWNYGELWYKEQASQDEPDLYKNFRDIWRVVFTPSPPVAKRIHDNFERMNFVPGEFATAHIRALYAVKDRSKAQIETIAKNAMNCVSNLRPGGPFFVASDSLHAMETAIHYARQRNVTVGRPHHPRQPLHLDFQDETDTSLTPAHFYDGFVDLFLMAGTRCAAVGPGGFARWGHLLGYNDTCVIHHFGRKSRNCEWKDAADAAGPPGYPSEEERRHLQAEAKRDIPRFPMPSLV